MSSCNGPPIVSTLSGMVAMAGEAEKEVEEEGKPPKKVKDQFFRCYTLLWLNRLPILLRMYPVAIS